MSANGAKRTAAFRYGDLWLVISAHFLFTESGSLFNDFIGACEQRGGDIQGHCFGDLEINGSSGNRVGDFRV